MDCDKLNIDGELEEIKKYITKGGGITKYTQSCRRLFKLIELLARCCDGKMERNIPPKK